MCSLKSPPVLLTWDICYIYSTLIVFNSTTKEALLGYEAKKYLLSLFRTLELCVQICSPYKLTIALYCSLWRPVIRLEGADSHAEPAECREAFGAGSVTTLIRGIINPFIEGFQVT